MITIKTITALLLLPLVAAANFSQLWSNTGKLTPVTAWKHAGQKDVDVWSVGPPSPDEDDPKAWAQKQGENPSSWANPAQPQRGEVPTSWASAGEPQREEVPTSWASAGEPQREESPRAWVRLVEPGVPKGWEQENSLVGEDHQPEGWNVFEKSSKNLAWNRRNYPNWPTRD